VSAHPMDATANTHWELVTEGQSYSIGQERPGQILADPVSNRRSEIRVEAPSELTGGEWLWGETSWFPSPKPRARPTVALQDPVLTGSGTRVTSIHSRQPWAELRCDGQSLGRLGDPVREWEARMGAPTSVLSQPEVWYYQRALVDIGLFVKEGVVEKIVLAEPGQLRPLLTP